MFCALTKRNSTLIRFHQIVRHAKFVQKSREVLREELETKRFKIVKDALTSGMKQKKCLSVSEWKEVITQLKKNTVLICRSKDIDRLVFTVLLSLRPPHDSMLNARNFIEANNLSYDFNVKRSIIELYAKKHAEDRLSDEEEKELIAL